MNISEIQSFLDTDVLGRSCSLFTSIDSTSSYLRRNLEDLPDGHLAVSDEQLAGRGRTGKTFYSPKGDGLYFSFILKEKKYTSDPLLTIKLSYAVCRAVDKLTGTEKVGIKWVNDIYIDGRKIAGVLSERVKSGGEEVIIVGIGVNFRFDKGAAPKEIRGKCASLRDVSRHHLSRAKLCALILNEIEDMYKSGVSDEEFIELYRVRSIVLGREISVIKDGGEMRAAALDIAKDGALVVRYESGITEKLTAGEISVVV